jgi:hypothetical protein
MRCVSTRIPNRSWSTLADIRSSSFGIQSVTSRFHNNGVEVENWIKQLRADG